MAQFYFKYVGSVFVRKCPGSLLNFWNQVYNHNCLTEPLVAPGNMEMEKGIWDTLLRISSGEGEDI